MGSGFSFDYMEKGLMTKLSRSEPVSGTLTAAAPCYVGSSGKSFMSAFGQKQTFISVS
jgi:hypothetical protein